MFKRMVEAAARETAETQAAIWTADRMRDMTDQAIRSAADMYRRRWGKDCAALVAELNSRTA